MIASSYGRRTAALVLLSSALAVASVRAQPVEPFSQLTQVTAHELVVGMPPVALPRPLLLPRPPALDVADLTLERDGASVRPVGLIRSSERPWRFLVYVDLLLSSPRQVRWQAETLLAELEGLLDRGSLEIVVASPEAARLLPPTQDEAVAREALSRLALTSSSPERVEQLRQDFARALSEAELGMRPDEFASRVLAEERRVAAGQMDRLLTWLAGEAALLRAPKALVFSPGDLDLVPDEFYREALGPAGLGFEGGTDLPQVADALARNVAALGWVTIGLDGPGPEELLLAGKRIGKWRFKKPAWTDPGFIVVREAQRDPKLAEGHLELAESLLAAGKASAARAALEKAIHHFYRDPRTADRQAVAWRELGHALEVLGEPEAALRAFKTSARLDPAAAPLHAPLVAAEARTRSLFDRLERSGLGWTVTHPAELSDVLVSLGRLLIVSYQTEEPPDGRLRTLAVRRRGGEGTSGSRLSSAGWSASGTTEGIAAARLRRFLEDGALEAGGLRAGLDLRRDAERLELRVRVEDRPADTLRLRVSVGVASPLGVEVEHHLADRSGAPAVWKLAIDRPGAPRSALIALVEDLATGDWTAAWFDL